VQGAAGATIFLFLGLPIKWVVAFFWRLSANIYIFIGLRSSAFEVFE
jgi:hypothetical protein